MVNYTLSMPRYTCPRCGLLLDDHRLDGLRVYQCHQCTGHAVNLAQLRTRMPADGYRRMWQAARSAPAEGPGCSVCSKPMRAVMAGKPAVEIDVCIGCQMLWLDAGEQEKLGMSAPPPGTRAAMSVEKQAAHQAADVLLAQEMVRSQAEQHRMKERTRRRLFVIDELMELLLWFSI